MSVSKKDFEAIAKIINNETLTGSGAGYSFKYVPINVIVERLSYYFETQNAQFDRHKFYVACGVYKND